MKSIVLFALALAIVECQYAIDSYIPPYYVYNALGGFRHINPWLLDAPQHETWLIQDDKSQKNELVGAEGEVEGRTRTKGYSWDDARVSPRFFLGGFGGNGGVLFRLPGGFGGGRTLIYTTVKTTTIAETATCVPASNFANGAGPCARRRRDIESFVSKMIELNEKLDRDALATPVQKLETTALPTARGIEGEGDAEASIKSSMTELEDVDGRAKRFLSSSAKTLTSWVLVTKTQYSSYNLGFNLGKGPCLQPPFLNCQLACIPPGVTKCPTASLN